MKYWNYALKLTDGQLMPKPPNPKKRQNKNPDANLKLNWWN
jgi:hypothetical protein